MAEPLRRRKDVLAWCLYDWANSAFVTSVVTVVLPVYFLSILPNGKGPVTVAVGGLSLQTNGDALWMYLTGFYMLAAGVAAPILGAIADEARGKKAFLGVCVVVGSLLLLCACRHHPLSRPPATRMGCPVSPYRPVAWLSGLSFKPTVGEQAQSPLMLSDASSA